MNTDVTKVKVQSFLEERTYANTERRTVRRWHVSWFNDVGQVYRLTFSTWEEAQIKAQTVAHAMNTIRTPAPHEPPC